MKWPVLILVGILIKCSLDDIKEQKISRDMVIINLVIGSITMSIYKGFSIEQFVFMAVNVVIIFIFMFICHSIMKEQIGWGDVILIPTLGVYFSIVQVFGILFYACAFAAIYGGYLVLIKKVTRKHHIPFVPFILIGTVVQLIFC